MTESTWLITEGRCLQCKGPTTRISMIGRTGTYWYMHYTCEPLFTKEREYGKDKNNRDR